MSDWINDAANRAKEEDDDHSKREEAFSQQSRALWGGLINQLQQDMEGINQNQELVTRRLGGEKLRLEDDAGIKITKITYPAVYLRVRFDGKSIIVEREIVTNGESRRIKTEREQISFEMDSEYKLSMKNDEGVRLNIPEASQYLFTPLLNTHTIK